MSLIRRSAIAAALAVALLNQPARAAGVEDFYRGKSVTLAIGFSVGGGYDLYGRLVARHLGKHIPGQPTIVPQNREGAGSLRATQFLYTAAPKDGTFIGTFSRGMIDTRPIVFYLSMTIVMLTLTYQAFQSRKWRL